MKAKVILMLLLAGMLSACSLDDDDDEWTSTMETWEINIEPEYVMGYSYWGAYTSMGKQMEGVNDKGEQIGRFFPGEIEGFTFEEGYRYKPLEESESGSITTLRTSIVTSRRPSVRTPTYSLLSSFLNLKWYLGASIILGSVLVAYTNSL